MSTSNSVTPAENVPTRFKITWNRGAYYVSIPNYAGGEVVRAEAFDALVRALEEIQSLEHAPTTDQGRWWGAKAIADAALAAAKVSP